MAKNINELDRLCAELQRLRETSDTDGAIRCVIAIIDIIDRIPSSRSRRIFRRRYIDRCTWSQIADEFGFAEANNAAQHVRRVKKRAF